MADNIQAWLLRVSHDNLGKTEKQCIIQTTEEKVVFRVAEAIAVEAGEISQLGHGTRN